MSWSEEARLTLKLSSGQGKGGWAVYYAVYPKTRRPRDAL